MKILISKNQEGGRRIQNYERTTFDEFVLSPFSFSLFKTQKQGEKPDVSSLSFQAHF